MAVYADNPLQPEKRARESYNRGQATDPMEEVARSYGFTFVFIMARAPHLLPWHWKTNEDFVTYRWFLVFAALIVPDLILQWDELFRRRKVRIAA